MEALTAVEEEKTEKSFNCFNLLQFYSTFLKCCIMLSQRVLKKFYRIFSNLFNYNYSYLNKLMYLNILSVLIYLLKVRKIIFCEYSCMFYTCLQKSRLLNNMIEIYIEPILRTMFFIQSNKMRVLKKLFLLPWNNNCFSIQWKIARGRILLSCFSLPALYIEKSKSYSIKKIVEKKNYS